MRVACRGNALAWLMAIVVCLLATPGSAGVLYSTSFDGTVGSLPSGWTAVQGSTGNPGWRIDPSGTYTFDTPVNTGVSHYTGLTGLADFVVESNFRKTSGSYTGLVARLQDASNFYHARIFGTGSFELYKFAGGTATSLASTSIPAYTVGETWKLQMLMAGKTITARLYDDSGQKVASVAAIDAGIASGTAGVRSGGGGYGAWDDFTVFSSVPSMTIKTSDGNGADSYVEYMSPDANRVNYSYGGATTVVTKNAGPDPSFIDSTLYRKVYLRFDLSALGTEEVDTAVLRLTPEGYSTGVKFNLYGLNDGHAGENWLEGTATGVNVLTDGNPGNDNWLRWSNAPANTASDNSLDLGSATLLGQFDGGPVGTTLEILDSDLRNFINADTNGLITLIITRDWTDPAYGGAIHPFRSKEYSDLADQFAPALFLVAGQVAVPEPGAWLLLLLGVAGIWRLRRAR